MEDIYGYSHLQILFLTVVVCLLLQLIRTKYRHGLQEIPGPCLASISNLDRVWSCVRGLQMNYQIDLHRKYGPLVRIGPSHVSFSDPELIPQVYGISSGYEKLIGKKSDFYKPFDVKSPEKGWIGTTFSMRNEREHRELKRPVANAFSMGSMKELEPMNDACSAILLKKLETLVGHDFDLGTWLHYYAFDVISSVTFSNRFGFMEQEKDIENIIASIEGRLLYNSTIGQVPYLHPYLLGNDLVSRLANLFPFSRKLNSVGYIIAFATRQLQRYHNREPNTLPLKDMLDRFKRFKDGEQVMDDATLLSHAAGNIAAGADTTAITLRALFYHLLRAPAVYRKLQTEIDAADRAAALADPITFAQAQNLPYFQACLKEALRIHPAVGMLLERVVPAGGAELRGVRVPGGTVVGMNPWVAARDTTVYGADADIYRPERWMEASGEELRRMERSFLTFGAGSRTCLGKNVSLLEISKLVPELLRKFEFELADPTKEWELRDRFFVQQTGLICRVKLRS